MQKLYEFQHIEYLKKKPLLYLHNHNYVNMNMLHYKQDFPLRRTILQVKKKNWDQIMIFLKGGEKKLYFFKNKMSIILSIFTSSL